jgi:endonuclease/exonuclease/phosphatase family metal-dependent hydrolase
LICRFLFSLCGAALLIGCSGSHALARLEPGEYRTDGAIVWFSPTVPDDRATLARWRASVGPPWVRSAPSAFGTPVDEITVVSWNTALGAADVRKFLETFEPARPIVLLLQEVYRGGSDVPRMLAADAVYAARLGGTRPGASSRDIAALAAALNMNAYYVPSMRNGAPSASDEDRGNAILSSFALEDLRAIELPFEKQRRVAVAATINGTTTAGGAWRLRVVSAHLDNSIPRRLHVASEHGRARQARGLAAWLQDEVPTMLGGDFNTWFGFSDQAYLEAALAFPQTAARDRRPTFRGLLRLDHLFYRLPRDWRAEFRRADSRFESDHSPLVATVRFR